MSKRDKALKKMRDNPKNVRYDELISLLMHFGFEIRNPPGSHTVYWHRDLLEQRTIPFNKPFVKKPYVIEALKMIDEILEIEEE